MAILVLYAVAAFTAVFLIFFAMVGDALMVTTVRRWWYSWAICLAVGAFLAAAWLR
jgi:hypothetical protein